MEKIAGQLKALFNELKDEIGVIAVEYSNDAFKKQAWDGKAWPERRSKDSSDRRNPTKKRALLIKTRQLQRSIRYRIQGDSVVISSDVPYAQAHNEGAEIAHPGGTPFVTVNNSRSRSRKTRSRGYAKNQAVFLKKDGNYPPGTRFTKPHKIKLPQRQIIGNSRELNRNIDQHISKRLDKFFKKK